MFSWGFRAFVGPLIYFVVVVWESFKGWGQVRVLYSGHPSTTLVAELKSPGDERKTVKKGSITPGLAPP
jgi:hypothetical protein